MADGDSEWISGPRAGWQGELAGDIYGEGWHHPRHADFPWGVVFNRESGEVIAVEILSPEKSGRVMLLATVEPSLMRAPLVTSALMRTAYKGHEGRDARNLFFLAGYLKGVADWIERPSLGGSPDASAAPDAADQSRGAGLGNRGRVGRWVDRLRRR